MGSSEQKVAVVGAGMAGLSAAWELRKRGFSVTVLERDARVGGRAWSETVEGFTLEPLSPILSTADRELLAWIDEVGVRDDFLPLRPLLVSQLHRNKASAVEPRSLFDFPRIPGVSPRQALRMVRLPRLMRRYGDQICFEAPERSADLDDRSLGDFGRLYFGATMLDNWMAPFATSTSLGDENETSRVHFLRHYARCFGARPALPRMPLRNLLDAACQGLAVLTRTEVRDLGRVESNSGQPSSIIVTYDREERERMFEVDAVVLATSAKAAARLGAKLLTTAEREMLASVRYAPTVTLALALCRPASWHAQEIRVPHGEGNPIGSVLLEPGQVGGRIPDGLGAATLRANHAYAARAMDLPEETIEKDLLEALDRVAPTVRGAIDFARLYRVERAWPRFDVGQYRAIARLTRVEDDRRRTGSRLYTTGDYRMDPSWIGAFLAGRQAAGRVAADLRVRSTP